MTVPAAECSARSTELDEPIGATAPVARAWVVLEQPGPWGREALTASHLDPGVGARLAAHAEGTGVRLLLMRRPGRHPDTHTAQRRRVYVAATSPGASWLTSTLVDSPEELLSWDLAALGAGRAAGGGEPVDEPVLFVCTNSRRDRCCALRARPVADELAAAHPGRVWECTHLGGHRFAPTALVLPYGLVYGRLTAERVHAELGQIVCGHRPGRERDDERILLWHRGLSTTDIALGRAMLERARDMGVGTRLPYR